MTVDNCSKMPNMVFSSESCGNKYYVNQDTNEIHCACGVEADFPHRCEPEPEKGKISKDDHYMLGVSVKEAIGMMLRCHNELHEIVMVLQDRVLQLELKLMDKESNATKDN